MGGFRFVGPNYVFQSLPQTVTCRCMGHHGNISETVEKYLLEKETKFLNVSDLPDRQLINDLKGVHIGDNMFYTVQAKVDDEMTPVRSWKDVYGAKSANVNLGYPNPSNPSFLEW